MEFRLSRRALIGLAGLGSVGLLSTACGSDSATPPTERAASPVAVPSRVAAYRVPPELLTVTVFKDPSCGCCGGWIRHAEEHGFSVTVEHPDALGEVFADHDISPDVQSCHLARNTAGTLLVGHVSARFALEYLADPPAGSRGLTVPAMPVGTPGMEARGQFDPYEVLLLADDGSTSVFAKVETASDQRV